MNPLRFWGPLLLLLALVGALTPFVEFSGGPMGAIANGRICSALLFALAAFLYLAGKQVRQTQMKGSSRRRSAAWLTVNLTLFGLFWRYTVYLANLDPVPMTSLAVGGWILCALAVGLTAFLVFFTFQQLKTLILCFRAKIGIALGLGIALLLLAPLAQGLWVNLHFPATRLNLWLLQCTFGESIAFTTREGWPVMGTSQMLLVVTPQCSELESLVAFWLLGATLISSRWRELRISSMALFLVLGSAILYVLNALRIFGLLLIGIHVSPSACVQLGHSRIGGMLLVGVAAGLLVGFSRWWRMPAAFPQESPSLAFSPGN